MVELELKLQFLADKRDRVGLSRPYPACPVFGRRAILCAKCGNLIFGSEIGGFGPRAGIKRGEERIP